MKRRDFLKLTGASVPAVSLLGCHDDGKVSNDVTLSNSYQYGVVNGPAMARVEVNENAPYTMNVERNAVAGIVQGIPLNYRTFNGKFPPDTLVAKPGDKMKITFVNNLDHSAEDYFHPADVNIPHGFNNLNLHTHGFNNLNLHTHGLNVSPTCKTLSSIPVGDTFKPCVCKFRLLKP